MATQVINNSHPQTTKLKESKDIQDSEILNDVYDKVVKDILNSNKDPTIDEVYKRIKVIMDYNITDGKKNRALVLINTYKIMKLSEGCSLEDLKLAAILGWCIEILQGFFLVLDDVMDNSITRRGKPCWYKATGLIAINDALLLEGIIYEILEKYFSNLSCYHHLVRQFQMITMKTTQGQCLDMLSTPEGTRPDLETFTESRYNGIVRYKTAYYSFVLPVRLALYLAGCSDLEKHNQAEAILLKMGHFFQVQDDYLDCFGDYATLGKIGTDIEDAKCSWLVVKALENATEAQKDIINQYYGINNPDAVNKIKDVYKELDLPKHFLRYEEDTYSEITKLIQENTLLPSEIYNFYLRKIYKRQKRWNGSKRFYKAACSTTNERCLEYEKSSQNLSRDLQVLIQKHAGTSSLEYNLVNSTHANLTLYLNSTIF
ncbi:FDPS [Cordylochernes scorpioides]|uniref:Farnesyl pyrophosphate synthase n=1 Tax=Cordylochernes scorpioides TaxID=51811 RepID=A0ABY6K2E8_9ARAC|nr:FDPS [Cordylochernes scorpioides]